MEPLQRESHDTLHHLAPPLIYSSPLRRLSLPLSLFGRACVMWTCHIWWDARIISYSSTQPALPTREGKRKTRRSFIHDIWPLVREDGG